MFKDEYKEAFDKLKPSADVKAYILATVSKAEKKESEIHGLKAMKFPVKRVIAAAAAVAVVITSVAVAVNNPVIPVLGKETGISSLYNIDDSEFASSVTSDMTSVVSKTSSVKNTASTVSKIALATKSMINAKQKYGLYETDYTKLFKAVSKIYKRHTDNSHSITAITAATKGNTVNYGKDGADGEDTVVKNETAAAPSTSDQDDEESASYTATNNQVKEVDEADVIKTDGKYIYSLKYYGDVTICKPNGKDTKIVSKIEQPNDYNYDQTYIEMYIYNNQLAIICGNYDYYGKGNPNSTEILVYDVSDPADPQLASTYSQTGSYTSSRLLNGNIYLITNEDNYSFVKPVKTKIKTYVPYYMVNGKKHYFKPCEITVPANPSNSEMIITGMYSVKSGKALSREAVFGASDNVYMNTDYLVISEYCDVTYKRGTHCDFTNLLLYSIGKEGLKLLSVGKVYGEIHNQFSMDIYKDHLRLVTTVTKYVIKHSSKQGNYIYYGGIYDEDYYENSTTNSLYVLNLSLEKTGSITGLAKDERIYSARFTEDTGYFVTFRETDPLFAVDLSNPAKPKILSALKIDGFSSYLHPFGKNLLLGFGQNTEDSMATSLKLTMFNTKDSRDVKEIVTKTVSIGDADSDALYDHKAFFADTERLLVGFSYYDYSEDFNYGGYFYSIYKYSDSKFKLVKKIELDDDCSNCRGMIIGDYFYICSENMVYVLNGKTFAMLKKISF